MIPEQQPAPDQPADQQQTAPIATATIAASESLERLGVRLLELVQSQTRPGGRSRQP